MAKKSTPLSRYLREARARRGVTTRELAQHLNVSVASVYFWENGHCQPRDAHLTALCKALKLPVRVARGMVT